MDVVSEFVYTCPAVGGVTFSKLTDCSQSVSPAVFYLTEYGQLLRHYTAQPAGYYIAPGCSSCRTLMCTVSRVSVVLQLFLGVSEPLLPD